ncbi:unnamed protein product [Notodromas monacha]|uniref:EF-hand domain-containing protein n=1 Tax=Notodromas monacha TaxID=399045 RepID=A0A7R9BNG7_9CRUS|nr:unnamed protein product [Notodromas monacha]CAG0917386.1 unnamed protein product [Notodromas monacha]
MKDVVYGVKMAMDEQVLDKMTWTLKLYEATGASQVAYSKVTAMARDAIKLAKGIETDKAELEQHTKTLMDVLSTYLTTAGASTSAQSYNLPTVISAVQTAANLYKTMGKNPTVFSKLLPGGLKSATSTFRAIDTDHDGQVNFQDFVYGIKMATDTDVLDRMTWALRLLEASGVYSLPFASTVFSKLLPGGLKSATSTFRAIDTDHDGQVNFQDFVYGIKMATLCLHNLSY